MKNWILRKPALGIAAISALVLLPVFGAHAAGALAIGTTGDLLRDGVGMAGYPGLPTQSAAIAAALKACRSGAGTRRAAAKCKIVATFSNQCFAYSGLKDPEQANSNNPLGLIALGWGLGPTKESAMSRAIAKCTASTNGAGVCTPGFSSCDVSGESSAAPTNHAKPNYYAIAASSSSQQEAQNVASRLGAPWQVVSTEVCKNYTQGLWVVVVPANDQRSASALAAKVKGYAKQCL